MIEAIITIIAGIKINDTSSDRYVWSQYGAGSTNQHQLFWRNASSQYRSRQDASGGNIIQDFGDANTDTL